MSPSIVSSSTLGPNRAQVGNEAVRHRVDDQIEDAVCEDAEIGHVALDRLQLEAFALCHQSILCELLRRVVEDRDSGSGRRQDWSLLAAAGCQAQNPRALEFGEP